MIEKTNQKAQNTALSDTWKNSWRYLAKAKVAGLNPVSRSKELPEFL